MKLVFSQTIPSNMATHHGWDLNCIYLKTIVVKGTDNSVVQIVDESNQSSVYTIRMNSSEFSPQVFKDFTYTIILPSERGEIIKLSGQHITGKQAKILEVNFTVK